MNRRYRLVYSRSRNMLVAVEETATSAGTAGEMRATGRVPRCSAIRLTLRRLLPAALLALAPMLTFAQIVAGGAHAPNVIQTPNGLDQVNINRPSGAGVSVNTYNRTLAASSGDLNVSGATTSAGGTLDARASGTLTNDNGAMSSGGAQTIPAERIFFRFHPPPAGPPLIAIFATHRTASQKHGSPAIC